MVYKGVNPRGVIVHCIKTKLTYRVKKSSYIKNAENFYEHGGSRHFQDTKYKIITKWYDLSILFLLSGVFVKSSNTLYWFDKSLIGKKLPSSYCWLEDAIVG